MPRPHFVNLFDFSARTITGDERPLSAYRGQVCLVVNVASKCGYTPQYAGLEALWRRHRDRGFVVLGFPCDQFGNQEPGGEREIQQFCSLSYDVTFPMFSKIDVNGPAARARYGSTDTPQQIEPAIVGFLDETLTPLPPGA